MIDSHCHLADKKFAEDLDEVIHRAKAAGVHRMVVIGDSMQESERVLSLAATYPEIFCTVGVHPHHAKDWKEGDADTLRAMIASSKRIRAVGEIGLDYHYNYSPREDQQRAFEAQLRLAKELELPAVVHNRESIADLRGIINRVDSPRLVLHCCTERWEDVHFLIERGYFLSFTGIATYPDTADIRETIRQCPLSQMMIETDAPYLAPVPHRGKRNEPAFVIAVARLIAEIKGVSLEEVDRVTTANAEGFFGLNVK